MDDTAEDCSLLDRKIFFIKQHVNYLRLADTYDILDPVNLRQLAIAKEKPGILRLFIKKTLLPTSIFVYEGSSYENERNLLFSIKKNFSIIRTVVNIVEPNGKIVGYFKSKFFSLGGAFRVFDADGIEIALIKGDWKGWNFKFTDNEHNEIGIITKKWAGIRKELFTTADDYMVSLSKETNSTHALLLLAAGFAIDTVYKENNL